MECVCVRLNISVMIRGKVVLFIDRKIDWLETIAYLDACIHICQCWFFFFLFWWIDLISFSAMSDVYIQSWTRTDICPHIDFIAMKSNSRPREREKITSNAFTKQIILFLVWLNARTHSFSHYMLSMCLSFSFHLIVSNFFRHVHW